MFNSTFQIEDRLVGIVGKPPLVIAELSGNHGGSLDKALELIDACADAGAEAVKFQTYTPDTITLKSDEPAFRVGGVLWGGRTLYDLYEEAHTPFEWHAALFERAHARGLIAFSTPFDETAIDLLESLGAPAYKIASCELNDLNLIAAAARTGKPVIVSTGASTEAELDEALAVLAAESAGNVAILHCISAYPTPLERASIATISALRCKYGTPIGFSDHTTGLAAAQAAVALGATIIEKHVCLRRNDGDIDSAFSLEPHELSTLIHTCNEISLALGTPKTDPLDIEMESRRFKRSLFVTKSLAKGDVLDASSVRSIRPAGGLHPRHLGEVIGRKLRTDVAAGTPLSWEMLD